MKRTFERIHVSSQVNVSSSGHYSAHCTFYRAGKPEGRVVTIPDMGLLYKVGMGEIRVPAYVRREIARQMVALLENGAARYYEYDRDGNKRYDGLRYHTPEAVAWITKCLKEETD